MVEIITNNLINEISELKNEEKIFVTVEDKLIKKLNLYNFRLQAYENLYHSYINNTSSEANKMNLKNFLDLYSELYLEQKKFVDEIVLTTIGSSAYSYIINNNINYVVNWNIKKIIIFKNNIK
jgi:hypothetical protein